MPTLLFTVGPQGVGYIHDFLSCLAKFDEDISLEATPQFLRISSLNISKTAHAAFTLSSSFFTKYHFSAGPRRQQSGGQSAPKFWSCKLQNRALLSIFKRRLADQRDRDTALDNCECELQDNLDEAECRLIFRLNCRQGVVKTYRLFYESGEILHAAFDDGSSPNRWTVSSRTLRDVVEYFGPKTDQLDWFYQNGKVTFTSYTEKIQSGREILKQPMHTSVALERKDFTSFDVQEGLHIGTMVKDFRAIVSHAESMRAQVTAKYSRGNRPLQITYEDNGLTAEFTLMTRGNTTAIPSAAAAASASTPARDLSLRPVSRPPGSSSATTTEAGRASFQPAGEASSMPPPPANTSMRERDTLSRPNPPRPALSKIDGSGGGGGGGGDSAQLPAASLNPESLFIPVDDDDDQQWDEPNFDTEPDIVTWDNTADDDVSAAAASSSRRIRDSELHSFAASMQEQNNRRQPTTTTRSRFPHEIEPTQRLSQVRGIFD
ncbi:uncharacterized protein PV06_01092 [Exophiala oligosperma]|uniref:DNA repair protein rad9 n=1 Tax=Exophiala oligosperma TaxID=215243 RepID=A0A0D2E191_9EURO|nr:uncharacterized protein PV06_01092 [Exophiala oligosperma]KIW48515.1 hypothetical protein PV06_01092 [Exophiala oligosperma]